MDRLIVSGPGFPGTNEMLKFLDEAHSGPLERLGHIMGNNAIVSGLHWGCRK
jgi:hypothetical protein